MDFVNQALGSLVQWHYGQSMSNYARLALNLSMRPGRPRTGRLLIADTLREQIRGHLIGLVVATPKAK